MHRLSPSLRVILIGGTSHSGKSTLAQALAAKIGWECRSTDKLARHPGRPWKNDGTEVPPHVVEHYSTLSVDDLVADVLGHYQRTVLPLVEELVRVRASDPSAGGLVLEGSALWPEFVAPLRSGNVAAVWLTASEQLLRQRIHAESRYEEKSIQQQLLIGKFLERTLLYGRRMNQAIGCQEPLSVAVSAGEGAETMAENCLDAIVSNWPGPR